VAASPPPSGPQPPASALSARTAARTVLGQTAGRGLTLLAVIASTAVVTRSVGVSTFADWATALSLVAMLGFLLDPGISPIVVRRLSQDPALAPAPRDLLRVRLVLAAGAVVVVTAATGALRGLAAVPLALVLAAQLVPRAAVLNAGAWLQADHRLHRQSALEAALALAGLAALATAAALGAGAEWLAAVGFTIPAVVLAGLMRRELALAPSARATPAGDGAERVRSVLREAAPLAGALILVSLYARLHVVFVNAAEDAQGVAEYLLAFQFIEQLFVVAGILAGTLLPLLAARAARVDLLADRSTHDGLVGMAVLGASATAVLIAAAEPLVRLLGGEQLAGGATFLVLLAPMGTVLLVTFFLGYLYLALGLAGRYLRFNAAALAFNLVLHATLTLHYGALGAARVAWLTELLVIVLAAAPLWRAGAAGRSALLRAGATIAVGIVAAELTAAGALAPVLAGLLVLGAALALGAPEVRRTLVALRPA